METALCLTCGKKYTVIDKELLVSFFYCSHECLDVARKEEKAPTNRELRVKGR